MLAMHRVARSGEDASEQRQVGRAQDGPDALSGTSKWNKIEHRLFSFITMNWRGKPLVSLETIVNLTAAPSTRTGLEVYARLDEGTYPNKIKVPDVELKAVNLNGAEFHPEWNYRIKPRD